MCTNSEKSHSTVPIRLMILQLFNNIVFKEMNDQLSKVLTLTVLLSNQ